MPKPKKSRAPKQSMPNPKSTARTPTTQVPVASSSTTATDASAAAEEDEFEECLLYVETDDLRTVDEIFRGSGSGPGSSEHREIEITLHGLNTEEPIMELQGMHFSGRVEDPPGTALFFAPAPTSASDGHELPKLTSDITPPIDPVFGLQPQPPAPENEYHLAFKADKIIHMKRIHTQTEPEFEDYGYIRTFEDTSDEEDGDKEKEPPENQNNN